jgi:hypothetical protein
MSFYFYKNDAIVFGKALCTYCGSDCELLHVELSTQNQDTKKISSHETLLCRTCYSELPDREEAQDLTEEVV